MKKTTVLLRKDVYNTLINKFGKRKISEAINNLLFQDLIKKRKKTSEAMFGSLKGKLKPFVREHHDRIK